MEFTKTVKIKIGDLTNHKSNIIDYLLKKNLKGLNYCINTISKNEIYSQKELHHKVYQNLRKLNLPACVCHSVRQKSIEIMKSFKKKKTTKKKPELKISRVRFDNVQTKLIQTKTKMFPIFISLLYKAGIRGKSERINLPLILNSQYQRDIMIKILNDIFKLGSSEIVKKNDEFYIHISYSKEVDVPKPDKTFSPIGIDIGINNLAVSVAKSKTVFHSGKQAKWKRKFFSKQRSNLQKNFALQEIKKQKSREWRWMTSLNHKISESIVTQALQEEKPVIVLEDLKHIRKSSKNLSKTTRRFVNSWAFKQLQDMIIHKANWEGMPVEFVNPQYSSQRCNKCHTIGKRDKHTFKCDNCGYQSNADYNAGRNLQQFFFAKCKGEQATINMAFDIDNSEPQATKIVSVENLNNSERRILW